MIAGYANSLFAESYDSPIGVWISKTEQENGKWITAKTEIFDSKKARYTTDNGRIFFYKIDDQGRWEGHWVEDGYEKCWEKKHGSYAWGVQIFQFNGAYTEYEGTWDYCGKGKKYLEKGKRQ